MIMLHLLPTIYNYLLIDKLYSLVYNYYIALKWITHKFVSEWTKFGKMSLLTYTLQITNVFIWTTNVCAQVPKVSVKVTPTDRTVSEGDTVSITCVCNPPPDKYMLSSSLVSQKTYLSKNHKSQGTHLPLQEITFTIVLICSSYRVNQ